MTLTPAIELPMSPLGSCKAMKQSSDSIDSAIDLVPLSAVEEHVVSSAAKSKSAKIVTNGHFESEQHFYPRVLNAQIHPLVSSFFGLGNERIIARFIHLNPQVKEEKLREILAYKPQYFAWAGCDLFNVTDSQGHRNMIVIETNSCPSGQKSMPLLQDNEEFGGYGVVIDHTFRGLLEQTDKALGKLAVVYDKNLMEASGYASVMSDLMKEDVYLVEYSDCSKDPAVRWVDRLMQVRNDVGDWIPIRACFRYVTQKPWNRLPLYSRTLILNSIISCLAGGRNKMMAARAYDFYNAELESEDTGLSIRVPETFRNISKNEIPLLLERMGGHAVIKVPYSNAGQGVYTITNDIELKAFMEMSHHYDKFIVQSLVGNASWSSNSKSGKFYHVGTIPNRKNQIFVSDLRMMIAGSVGGQGFKPVAIYARRARKPLLKHLSDDPETTSWEMLGTNLSVKLDSGVDTDPSWTTETQRLLLMDRKDFNCLGLGVDDMIDAYVQTVLSVVAIDKMCQKLVTEEVEISAVVRDEESQASNASSFPEGDGEFLSYNSVDLRNTVEVVSIAESVDGTKVITEKVSCVRRRFDLALFQALNPDDALLQEILLK